LTNLKSFYIKQKLKIKNIFKSIIDSLPVGIGQIINNYDYAVNHGNLQKLNGVVKNLFEKDQFACVYLDIINSNNMIRWSDTGDMYTYRSYM